MRDRTTRMARMHPQIERPPELPPGSAPAALGSGWRRAARAAAAGAVTLARRRERGAMLSPKETERGRDSHRRRGPSATEGPDDELVLPGNLQAFEESPIYARTNGYLLRWYKDIGSQVKQGELLATIDTPEVDQELSQARAARQQVKAAIGLAKITADRWANLRKTDSVSQQEADQQTSGYQQARPIWQPPMPTCAAWKQLESFKNVYAPFSGVITRRNVDPGALINAGAQAAGKELFDIARVDPLRVYVSVPQAYAPSMKVGVKATVTLQEFPGQKFTAVVARTADAIDTGTRTLLTEVDVPNKDGRLLPGSFGQVHFATGNPFRASPFRSTPCCFAPKGRRRRSSDRTTKCSCTPS